MSAIHNYFSRPTRYAASGFPGTDKPDGRIGQYLRHEGSSLWISKESLNAAYRAMWTPWVGDCHPPTNEALNLLEFVLEHTDEAGKCPPWEKLRVLWNERFPARKFTTYSGIRRAHTRAKEKLAPRRR